MKETIQTAAESFLPALWAMSRAMYDHPELGLEIMRRFADAMSEVANVEKPAKLEGRTMLMFLAPKPAK